MRFLIALLLLTTPAIADERFIGYVNWIADNSVLEYNGEPLPTIEYRSQEYLQVMGYGPETVARAERENRELPKVLAAYDDYIIYIVSDDVFEEKPWVAVHELVHFLQDVNGVTNACIPANEPLAYRLHDKWQAEHGYEAERNSANIFYGLTMAMSCYDRHP